MAAHFLSINSSIDGLITAALISWSRGLDLHLEPFNPTNLMQVIVKRQSFNHHYEALFTCCAFTDYI